jgi:hypothetical protein
MLSIACLLFFFFSLQKHKQACTWIYFKAQNRSHFFKGSNNPSPHKAAYKDLKQGGGGGRGHKLILCRALGGGENSRNKQKKSKRKEKKGEEINPGAIFIPLQAKEQAQ